MSTVTSSHIAGDEPISVGKVIDAAPIGGYQIIVLALCAVIMFFDGFDTQLIAFIAPSVTADFHLTRAELGPLFSASLVGFLLGALFFGPLADRFGRRTIVLVCTLEFSFFTLMGATSTTFYELLALRFVAGLGMGGAMPNAAAIVAEYSPLRRRSTMVMLMFLGFGLGGAIGGFVSAWLLPIYGWKGPMIVGGLLPLLLVPILYFTLPESIRFLVLENVPSERITQALRKVVSSFNAPAGASYVISMEGAHGMPVAQLFRSRPPAATLLLWFIFFGNLFANFTLQSWIPILSNDIGVPLDRAVIIGALYQVGGVIASIVLGYVMDKLGPFKTIPLAFAVSVPVIILIGQIGPAVGALMVLTFTAGFCISGGQNCCNALAAMFYPTAVRSTGIGWALGIGRFGAILGPIAAGWLLAAHMTMGLLFILLAIVPTCAGIACIIMGVIAKRAGPLGVSD